MQRPFRIRPAALAITPSSRARRTPGFAWRACSGGRPSVCRRPRGRARGRLDPRGHERVGVGAVRRGRPHGSADRARLSVDDTRAFLDQTNRVPEVVLSIDGAPPHLRIRWYKLTSEAGPTHWVRRLAERGPPRSRSSAAGRATARSTSPGPWPGRRTWAGAPPLLLITTATANTVVLDPDAGATPDAGGPKPLMSVYPGRSFRFCFTNRQMASAVVRVRLVAAGPRAAGAPGVGGRRRPDGGTRSLAGAALLAAHATACPPTAAALEWDDDPYSVDLSNSSRTPPPSAARERPGPADVEHPVQRRRVLSGERLGIRRGEPPYRLGQAVPPRAAVARPAGGTGGGAACPPVAHGRVPLAGRHLVAVCGDSMNINTVYRDADIAWDIRAMPVPIVSSPTRTRSPGTRATPRRGAGRRCDGRAVPLLPPNGTDDVLLHADLVQRLGPRCSARRGRPNAGGRHRRGLPGGATPRRGPRVLWTPRDRRGGRGEFVLLLRTA